METIEFKRFPETIMVTKGKKVGGGSNGDVFECSLDPIEEPGIECILKVGKRLPD